MFDYFVRIGTWGDVVRCRTRVAGTFSRGHRVICRTGRGLEVGMVTGGPEACTGVSEDAQADIFVSTIIRKTTVEDELLLSRLEKHRRTALDECRRELADAASTAVLLDVDQLFDAGTLIFYFLDELEPASEELVQRLAERYESRVRSRHFAKLINEGCGPGCGTQDAHGGGCSRACAVCVVGKK